MCVRGFEIQKPNTQAWREMRMGSHPHSDEFRGVQWQMCVSWWFDFGKTRFCFLRTCHLFWHLICCDILTAVFGSESLKNIVKGNFYLNDFRLFNLIIHISTKHSLVYCDQWHFPPAPSNFVHLGIKLSLCLSVFLSNYSELFKRAKTSHL